MHAPIDDATVAVMREAVPNTAAFPTARCEPCAKSVLTYVTLDERGDEVRCCMHCDGVIAEQLRWLTASELEAEGYEIGYRPDAEQKAGGGCSSGCGTCSTRK
jgi:hypothetical protein